MEGGPHISKHLTFPALRLHLKSKSWSGPLEQLISLQSREALCPEAVPEPGSWVVWEPSVCLQESRSRIRRGLF